MNNNEPLLKVRFDGKAIGTGKIPVSHLLRFLTNMNKVLQRTGQILMGESQSQPPGLQPRNIKEEISLDLVLLTHGSPATVLGFDLGRIQSSLPGMDLGLNILEKTVADLSAVQKTDKALPVDYDAGVLMAWSDTGKLFNYGVEKIEFTLNHRKIPLSTVYTPQGFARIQERIKGPQTNIRTIEGRLLMADFKEHGTRCRVHPSAGKPVLCLFDNKQKEEVLENILQYVRIVGEAKEDPISGKITSIKIHDIEQLEEKENEAVNLLPQGSPISQDFWESLTIDELAESQNVKPMLDVRTLFGTWPDKEDDGFEETINELRHRNTAGGKMS